MRNSLLILTYAIALLVSNVAAEDKEGGGRVTGAPAWFTETRIHAHTRLAPLALEREAKADPLEVLLFENDGPWGAAYTGAGRALSDLGVSVFTRHAKTMDEPPVWPTAFPQGIAASDRDLISPLVREAREASTHMLTYYWNNSDKLSADFQPEWVCRDDDGKIVGHPVKGPYMDLSSPYGDVVLGRLIELKQLGVSGIYLDGRHFPHTGCFGTLLEEKFRLENADFREMNVKSGRFWRAFRVHQAREMARVINEWADALRDENFAVIVSVTSLPALINPEMTYDLARAGAPKTEYHIATRAGIMDYVLRYNPDLMFRAPREEARMAFGWSLLRTVSQTAPHVWINGVPTLEQLRLAVGAVITHGGIANVDIDERNITASTDVTGVTPRAALEAIYALNEKISAAIGDAHPLEYAAVLFNEKLRNSETRRRAWTNTVVPAVQAFDALLSAGVPVTGIDDRILEEGDLSRWRVIVAPSTLADNPKALENIRKHGATLFTIDIPGYLNFYPESAYTRQLAPVIEGYRSTENSVQLLQKSAGDQGTIWHDPDRDRYVVSIVQPFGWVQTGSRFAPAKTPHRRLSEWGAGDTAFALRSEKFSQTKYCARDGLGGAAMPFSEGELSFDDRPGWRLVVIEPCAR